MKKETWWYRCKLCSEKISVDKWTPHLVDNHWVAYITNPEPSSLMTDWSEEDCQ